MAFTHLFNTQHIHGGIQYNINITYYIYDKRVMLLFIIKYNIIK